jgi:hypothetical protein
LLVGSFVFVASCAHSEALARYSSDFIVMEPEPPEDKSHFMRLRLSKCRVGEGVLGGVGHATPDILSR